MGYRAGLPGGEAGNAGQSLDATQLVQQELWGEPLTYNLVRYAMVLLFAMQRWRIALEYLEDFEFNTIPMLNSDTIYASILFHFSPLRE